MGRHELWRLAWRNVWRNRRRSVLNVVALTVGMSILLIALAWIGGYHRYIYGAIRDYETGELQVTHPDWYENQVRLPVDTLIDYQSLRTQLTDIPGIRAVSGRVQFPVQIGTGRQSWRMVGIAIDPQWEHLVGSLDEQIVAGQPPSPSGSTRGIWLGRLQAEKAGVSVGDTLFLRAMNRHGVENLYDAPVVGLFSYGYPALDDMVVYLDLTTATELLDLDGGVTHLVARTTDREVGDELLTTVRARLGNVSVRPWQDFARAAVSAVEGDTVGFSLLVAILYLLIVLGILNSMSMSVHERTREIGTMRAIGMRAQLTMRLVAAESIWQSVIAAVIAVAITAPLIWWLTAVGVDIASNMPADMPVPFGERLRSDIRVWHYVFTFASGVGTALIGAIIPGRRAARIVVADAMRERG